MTISIPSSLQTTYEEVCDLFLTSDMTSRAARIYYPGLKIECINCQPSTFSGSSIYKPGGPYPFEGICPYCDGKGYKYEESYTEIRLRFYFGKNYTGVNYRKIPENLEESTGYIIGPRSQLVNIGRADYIQLNYTEIDVVKFRLSSEPQPWGFGNRYFTANISILK